ncbi:hypothetical protein [Roseisolibacter sp. H3M3-2]|uniref:hypothetical protein n=1 Tax=Roseisolibacter sp. H3M3-2 TaxID=3031323 RepID=UPI0023DADF27|nr:hypothetical protein [Roseisolibacter sp. H3M3-2]MDF1502970.1 hypothetical protein [Roseisolibacter sp. H3M3-2]
MAPLFGGAPRDGRQRATAFVRAVWADPAEEDVQWLATTATGGDVDHARWELRYARRALGLLAAQRDALDDRTGSLEARATTEAMAADPAVAVSAAALAERQFNDRLAAYRDALQQRSSESPGTRLGRVLLVFAGSVRAARGAGLQPAGELLGRYLDEANAALRQAFGEASLPEDRAPSTLAKPG